MIVLGIDPGARETGIAIAETADRTLLAAYTVKRPTGSPLLDVEDRYLFDVQAAVEQAVRDFDVRLAAVEGLRRPSWRKQGKVSPIDPSAVMATAVVLGAVRVVLRHRLPVPYVVVPPDRNGAVLSWRAYPPPIAPAPGGRGQDKHRHERSAFDVACAAPSILAMARASRSPLTGSDRSKVDR